MTRQGPGDELISQLLSTQWTALAAGDVGHIIRAYWKPIFRFLRARLPDEATTEDLTQDFFLRFVERDLIDRVDREQGRFRSFLFHAARQFLIDHYRRQGAARRGGQVAKVPVEEILDLAGGVDEPREAFDRHWFSSLVNQARKALKDHYLSRDMPQAYQAFHLFYYGSGEPGHWTQKRIAAALDLPVTQVNNYLHRSRVLLSQKIQDLVAGYSATQEEAEEEMRSIARFLEGHRHDGTPASTIGLSLPGEDPGEA